MAVYQPYRKTSSGTEEIKIPVSSVEGAVAASSLKALAYKDSLSASDVGALPNTTVIPVIQ